MAQKGLKSFLYSKMSEETEETYQNEAEKLAGAIECNVDIALNDAKLYADDVLRDEDNSFVSGTIKLKTDGDDINIFQPLMGSEVTTASIGSSTDNITVSKSNTKDEPVFIGFGYITKSDDKYRIKFYPKVRFKPYDTSAKTKADKTEYVTPDVEGTIYPLASGEWRIIAEATTEADAVAYLKSLFTQAPTDSNE